MTANTILFYRSYFFRKINYAQEGIFTDYEAYLLAYIYKIMN